MMDTRTPNERGLSNKWAGAWISGLLCLALLVYAAVRADTVSFTYDECYTFLEHVSKDRLYQDRFDQMGGNHHLLNVWLMWLAWKVFGANELVLRLPSLLAFGLYLYASMRIALRAQGLLLAMGVFLLLVLHPYLLDFFALARGYALGHAFLMLALWQGVRYLQDGKQRHALVWAMVFASLSALSHVIMINFLLAFGGALGSMLLVGPWQGVRPVWKHLVLMAGIGSLGLLIILPNALGLFNGGSLNFGCADFWNCTVRSLAEKLVYHVTYGKAPLVIVEKALWCGAGAWLISAVIVWRSGTARAMGPAVLGLLTLGLCLLSVVLQQLLFGVPLPETRTALFLLPITAFTVVAALLAWPRWRAVAGAAALVGCVPLCILFHDAFNLKYVVEWRSASELRRALEIIAVDHVPLGDTRPAILVRTGFETEGGIPYYMRTRGWHWLGHAMHSDTAFQPADYYLVEYDANHLVDTLNWIPLFHSDETGLSLFRDRRLERSFTDAVHISRFSGASHEEGRFPFLEWVVPQDGECASALVIGSLVVQQEDAENWVSLKLEIRRDGKRIGGEDRPSHEQIPTFGNAVTTSVVAPVLGGLMPGDTVRFTTWPCFDEPRIIMGEATLRVMR